MITITQQAFMGETDCAVTINFETLDEYIGYCEYNKKPENQVDNSSLLADVMKEASEYGDSESK